MKTHNNEKELILTLTRRCNMRCAYCYQFDNNGKNILDDTGVQDMTFETIENAIDMNPDIDIVRFYGGEPLLASDLIMQTMDKYPDKKYSITTNGLLNNHLPPRIWEMFDTVKLSFDGIDNGERTNGKVSQHKVIKNLEKIKSLVKNINVIVISVTLRSAHYDDLFGVLMGMYNVFEFRQFEVGFDAFSVHEKIQAEYNFLSFCRQIIRCYEEFNSANLKLLLLLRDQFSAKNSDSTFNCSYLDDSYVAIDVDGSISKCHVAAGLGLELDDNEIANISNACPLVEKVNPNSADAIREHEKYIQLIQILEAANIKRYYGL